MIVGAARWNDRGTWYVQTNDLLEEIRRKLGDRNILQSCGSNAAASCMEAIGYDLATVTSAGYSIPADDLLTEYLNNPRNYDAFKGLGIDLTREPNNRHARLYPRAVFALWGARARWLSPFSWRDMIGHLRGGRALQVCITPPGHYIAVVACDTATGEYIANDSWPARPRTPPMNGNGFNIRLTEIERESIVAEAVVYYPPGDKGM